MTIHEEIDAYYSEGRGEHHRYRSWEHCYNYFHQLGQDGLKPNRDQAALHLAFYLASWGMYRGSSFLLQRAYTVHRGVIDLLGETSWRPLWEADFGAGQADDRLIPLIYQLIGEIRQSYRLFAPSKGSAQPTDTLITKIVLGTLGCLPACDRYFIDGFKGAGFKYSYLNRKFIERIFSFCRDNLDDLRREQETIQESAGVHYPLMKIIDMYFWQIGYQRTNKRSS